MGSRATIMLRRLAHRRPWGGHVHVRAVAQCSEDEWEAVFDAVAEAAHELDEELFCSGNRDPQWSLGAIDICAYRMRRRAADALRRRVGTALVETERSFTQIADSICYRCRCLEESP